MLPIAEYYTVLKRFTLDITALCCQGWRTEPDSNQVQAQGPPADNQWRCMKY